MEKADIGAILRKRIKECGFGQEDFAEKSGISYSALKDYMSGTTVYGYDLLMKFSEVLNCSYDYLLGYSKAPIRENHEIMQLTNLSVEAIEKLKKYARNENKMISKNYSDVLNELIIHDSFIEDLVDYFQATKSAQSLFEVMQMATLIPFMKTGNEVIDEHNKNFLDTVLFGKIIEDITEVKVKMRNEYAPKVREQSLKLEKVIRANSPQSVIKANE